MPGVYVINSYVKRACIVIDKYQIKFSEILQSNGSLKVCGNYSTLTTITVHHEKDLDCKYGCFLGNDIMRFEYSRAEVGDILIDKFELDGDLFGWLLKQLIDLAQPLIIRMMKEKVEKDLLTNGSKFLQDNF